jgi:hypothetical protein
MKPFLIYDFATRLPSEFPYTVYKKNFNLFYQCINHISLVFLGHEGIASRGRKNVKQNLARSVWSRIEM